MKRKTLYCSILLIIICLAILSPVFLISAYNRPCADDYDYSLFTREAVQNNENVFGLLSKAVKTSVHFYNHWQGLYTSAFFLSLQPGIFGETYYAWASIVIVLSVFACLISSVGLLNKYYFHHSIAFVITFSMVMLTMLLLWIPSPAQGVFWYNGAMNYSPWPFAVFLNICLVLSHLKASKIKSKIVLLSMASVLSFIISGANHVTAFENILCLLILSAVSSRKKKLTPLIPFAMACIGFLIMYFAPGTAVRQAQFEQPTVIETIYCSMIHGFSLLKEWVSLPWFLSLLVMTPFAIAYAKKTSRSLPLWGIGLSILLSCGILCAMLCVPYYAMESFGASRITNVIWFSFVLFSWFHYFLLWQYLLAHHIGVPRFIKKPLIATGLVVLCLAALALVPNGSELSLARNARNELHYGLAKRYCEEMDERIARYNDPSLHEVQVKPLQNKSSLLFFNEIGTDPNVWPNTSISTYYNKPIYLVYE